MAKIPTYDNFQVTPNALPQTRLAIPDMPDIAGRQAQQMGQSMQRFGGELGQIALDMQAQANQVRFDAAATQAREEIANLRFGEGGYENLRGGDALFRPDNQYMPDEYAEVLQKKFEAISESLGNDAQRQVFSRYSGALLDQFRTGAMAHTNREYQVFNLSQARGTIAQRTDDIIRSNGDIDAIERAINGRTEMAEGQVMYVEKGLRQSAYEAAKLTGASDIEAKGMTQKAISEGLKRTISEALNRNNVTQADALLNRYREQMEGADVLEAQGKIDKIAAAHISLQAVSATEAEYAQAFAPNDMTRLRGIRTTLESGGRDFNDDGTPLASSKGALYKNQVLPSTARNPGFGIRPADESGTPQQVAAEFNRVGDELLGALVKRYGNAAMALAAYNAGHATVDKALKEADKKGTSDWTSFLPQETRDYITKGVRLFETGKGAPKRPTELEFVDTALQKLGSAPTAEQVKLTTEESKRRFDLIEKAHKQREEEAVIQAQEELIANGGNFAELPASIQTAIPPDKYDDLLTYAGKIAKGKIVQDPVAWAEVMTLNKAELAEMTPKEFLAKYRTRLDDKHLEKGMAMVSDARQDDNSDQKHLEITTTTRRVKTKAQQAGILPYDSKPSEKQAKAFAEFENAIDERVRAFEARLGTGRKATSDELNKIIDEVVLDTVFIEKSWWPDPQKINAFLSPEEQEKAYVKVGDEEIRLANIPVDQQTKITQGLQARGAPVTAQKIAEYWVRAGKPR